MTNIEIAYMKRLETENTMLNEMLEERVNAIKQEIAELFAAEMIKMEHNLDAFLTMRLGDNDE